MHSEKKSQNSSMTAGNSSNWIVFIKALDATVYRSEVDLFYFLSQPSDFSSFLCNLSMVKVFPYVLACRLIVIDALLFGSGA